MRRSRAAEGPIGRCRKSTAPRVQRARLHCAPWADPRCGTCAKPMRAQRAHSESADLESVAWAMSYVGMRRICPGPGRRVLHVRSSECAGVRKSGSPLRTAWTCPWGTLQECVSCMLHRRAQGHVPDMRIRHPRMSHLPVRAWGNGKGITSSISHRLSLNFRPVSGLGVSSRRKLRFVRFRNKSLIFSRRPVAGRPAEILIISVDR